MEERITGVMIYYYFVCSRKLWYFCHQINMEDENENVQLGKLLDENSYKRDDKHIEIDGIINIDFIHEKNELHEIKKSKSIEEAGIWQVKYYLYYLWKMLYKLGIMFSYENGTTGIKNFDINGFAQKERIIIPPKEIVYAFKQIIETFYVKIQTNGIESEQLAKTRDTLLPRLMSGELNTNDLNC